MVDSDDGYNDDADEEGNRAIPTRTYIGTKYAIGDKYPHVLVPLKLFWGLVVIEEYVYRCVLSNAKISIIGSDIARMDYKRTRNPDRPYSKKDYDESVVANEAIYQRYLAAQAAEKGEEINLTELLNNK